MKKTLSIILALTMLLSALVACKATETPVMPAENTPTAPVAAPDASAAPVAPEPESASIIRGGTLVAGKTTKWTTLDPTKTGSRAEDRYIVGQIFEPLLDTDASGNLVPLLAESWDVIDATTIVLKLRQGVVFHDGEEMNADAVKFVLDWYRSEECAHVFASELKELESIDIVDEYTIQLNLSGPSASLLYSLADVCGYMMSPNAIKNDVENLALNPVGTGPFKLKEAIEGDHITLVRNENYYEMGTDGQPLPYLDEVIVRIITDDTVKTTNLQSGEIQLVDFNNSFISTNTLAAQANIVTVPTQMYDIYTITFNLDDPALADLRVRQALSYAVDRDQLVAVMTEGLGETSIFATGANQWYFSNAGAYSFDPEKAKQLLSESGYPNGITLKLNNISREPDNTLVQLLQAQLAEVGFNLEVEPLERLAWVDLFGTQYGGQLGTCKYNLPRVDAYMQFNQSLLWLNPKHTEELKVMLEKTKGTYDLDERYALLQDYQEKYLGEAMNVFLYQISRYCSHMDTIQGLALRSDASWKLAEVWLAG